MCLICGYIHQADILFDDIICPLCKHGVADFEKIK
ncbi:MAG: rubredoxin-like domain-containing protein [Erysipelotrichaceae bacterium]